MRCDNARDRPARASSVSQRVRRRRQIGDRGLVLPPLHAIDSYRNATNWEYHSPTGHALGRRSDPNLNYREKRTRCHVYRGFSWFDRWDRCRLRRCHSRRTAAPIFAALPAATAAAVGRGGAARRCLGIIIVTSIKRAIYKTQYHSFVLIYSEKVGQRTASVHRELRTPGGRGRTSTIPMLTVELSRIESSLL
jgi:hypothetical protein